MIRDQFLDDHLFVKVVSTKNWKYILEDDYRRRGLIEVYNQLHMQTELAAYQRQPPQPTTSYRQPPDQKNTGQQKNDNIFSFLVSQELARPKK